LRFKEKATQKTMGTVENRTRALDKIKPEATTGKSKKNWEDHVREERRTTSQTSGTGPPCHQTVGGPGTGGKQTT